MEYRKYDQFVGESLHKDQYVRWYSFVVVDFSSFKQKHRSSNMAELVPLAPAVIRRDYQRANIFRRRNKKVETTHQTSVLRLQIKTTSLNRKHRYA